MSIRLRSEDRRPLAEEFAERLLEAIVGGDYAPGSSLPPEAELADLAGISRLTVREAVKALQAKGVLQVERGRGTFVNPTSSWSPLDPALLAVRLTEDRAVLSGALLEARRLVEQGVAEFAAERRSETHVTAMEDQLDRMRRAHRDLDVEAFVEADIAFHEALIVAANNPVLAALFEPISSLIHEGRRETSRSPEAREHAIAAHRAILEAVEVGDPDAARAAMVAHLNETAHDLDAQSAERTGRRAETTETEADG